MLWNYDINVKATVEKLVYLVITLKSLFLCLGEGEVGGLFNKK